MERIAIIDLGSNTARLVLAEIIGTGNFVVFDELKETVRLGQDMDRDGFLKPARVAQAVKTLKMFRKLCDSYNVEKVYAFATNALRRAKNQRSFIEEINAVCGFKFKLLGEEEEAAHIYYGVVNSLDIPKAVIMDISGSSLHLINYNRRNLLARETLPFGTVTLADLFNEPGLSPEEQAKQTETYVFEQLDRIQWLKELDPDVQFVGVGGAFRALARISKRYKRYPVDMIHNSVISAEDFNAVYDTIKVLPTDQRARVKGVDPARADVFVAAMSAVKSFLTVTAQPNIVVSACGIREGYLFNHAVPSTMEKPLSDVMGYSALTVMNHFGLDVPHAEQVCNLAIQLYKQLRVLHKLPRQYVKVLRIAALLSGAGSKIRFYDRNRHAFYAILNSGLYGVSHRDLVLAAFIANGTKRDEFSTAEWTRYKDLLHEEDYPAVVRLSVILRLAEAFDRSMSGAVRGINCDVLGDSVIMKTEVEGDASLEIKEAFGVSDEFYRAFRKNLEIL